MAQDLERFISAQSRDYSTALSEIKSGRKKSHWMWYIFPQYRGLGHSETSKYYAIQSIEEAQNYLNHPILGPRLRDICEVLLNLDQTDAHAIFGSPDDLKLKSSMTLFSLASDDDHHLFEEVLEKFFGGAKDMKTVNLVNDNNNNK